MRIDEEGNVCPETLGEYRDMVAKIGGDNCLATKLMDEKIAKQGRGAIVVATDLQMRALLLPLLITIPE